MRHESREEAAKSLVRVMLSEEAVEASTRLALDAILRPNPALESLRPAFETFFARYFTRDALVGELAPLYAARFTELELVQMRWFYATPTGKRALEEMPALMQAGGEAGRRIVKAHRAELETLAREHAADTDAEPGAL